MSRAYTLSEIDQMRSDIANILLCESDGWWSHKDRQEEVEMRLRTYLGAGVEPSEVADASRQAEEDYDKREAEYQ